MCTTDPDRTQQVFKGCKCMDPGMGTTGDDSDPDFEGDTPPPTDSDPDSDSESESEFPFPVGTKLSFRGNDVLHRDDLDGNIVYEAEIICVYDQDFCQVKFWDGATDDMHVDEVSDAEVLYAHKQAPLSVGTSLAFYDKGDGKICRVNDACRYHLYEVELSDGDKLDMCAKEVKDAVRLYVCKSLE